MLDDDVTRNNLTTTRTQLQPHNALRQWWKKALSDWSLLLLKFLFPQSHHTQETTIKTENSNKNTREKT